MVGNATPVGLPKTFGCGGLRGVVGLGLPTTFGRDGLPIDRSDLKRTCRIEDVGDARKDVYKRIYIWACMCCSHRP